ncbi:MAG: ATP-binding protein, partial [Chitinophagales bacterium]
QKNIFKIFKKLHRQNEFEGQGIGLSICKRIIERHDGEIWLYSKENEGTTFYFSLPIRLD